MAPIISSTARRTSRGVSQEIRCLSQRHLLPSLVRQSVGGRVRARTSELLGDHRPPKSPRRPSDHSTPAPAPQNCNWHASGWVGAPQIGRPIVHGPCCHAPTLMGTTSVSTIVVVQNLAQASISCRRLAKRSPRRYAASTLSPMLCAYAISATSRRKLFARPPDHESSSGNRARSARLGPSA